MSNTRTLADIIEVTRYQQDHVVLQEGVVILEVQKTTERNSPAGREHFPYTPEYFVISPETLEEMQLLGAPYPDIESAQYAHFIISEEEGAEILAGRTSDYKTLVNFLKPIMDDVRVGASLSDVGKSLVTRDRKDTWVDGIKPSHIIKIDHTDGLDNETYDLLSLAAHLRQDERVTLLKGLLRRPLEPKDCDQDAIASIPHYNAYEGRDQELQILVTLSAEEYDDLRNFQECTRVSFGDANAILKSNILGTEAFLVQSLSAQP